METTNQSFTECKDCGAKRVANKVGKPYCSQFCWLPADEKDKALKRAGASEIVESSPEEGLPETLPEEKKELDQGEVMISLLNEILTEVKKNN